MALLLNLFSYGKGSSSQSGNIFAVLFGAVALTGVLATVGMQTITGPISTATKVTQKNLIESNLLTNARLIVMNAGIAGDPDTDGFIEPIEYVPNGTGGCVISLTGGGCVPTTIGATLTDPFAMPYGYCVWDHGPTDNGHADGAPSAPYRLNGNSDQTQPVITLISAGPDKTFQSSCAAFDGAGTDGPVKPVGSDDYIFSYTYNEALATSGGLWTIQITDPTTAEIAKNLEIKDTGGTVRASVDNTTGIGDFLGLTTDVITAKTGGFVDVDGNMTISKDHGVTLRIDAIDAGGAPATTASILFDGYDSRAKGLFFIDDADANKWFIGEGYDYNGIGIGLDTEVGNQAEYAANAKFMIDLSGRVGIGKANPGYLLHIKGEYPYIAFEDTDDVNGTISTITSYQDGKMYYDANANNTTLSGGHIFRADGATKTLLTISNDGDIDALLGYAKDKAGYLRQNLLPVENWTPGGAAVPFFNANGAASENSREFGIGPHGDRVLLWKATPNAASDADGGWNTPQFPIDHTKTYRFSVWIKKTGSIGGTTYLGTFGGGEYVRNVSDGALNSNPYFWYGDLPQLDRWYLIVGYVYDSGSTHTTSSGGVYDGVTGQKVISGQDFRWDVNSISTYHRSYLYYDTTTTDRQYFWGPRVDMVDGDEPSISALLGTGSEAVWNYSGNNVFNVNSGNVGIGVNDGREKLDVDGDIYMRGDDLYFSHDAGTNANNDYIRYDDGPHVGTTGIVGFFSDTTRGRAWNTPTAGISAAGAYISGSVGIGEQTPAAPLDIGNDIYLGKGGGNTSTASDILFNAAGLIASEDAMYFNVNSDNSGSTHSFFFSENTETSGAKKIAQLYNGSTSTHFNLYPSNSGYSDFRMFTNAYGSDDYWRFLTYGDSYSNSGLRRDMRLYNYANGSSTFIYHINYNNGYMGIGDSSPSYRVELPNTASAAGRGRANAWNTYSDGRFKTDIKPIENALEKVAQLQGITYKSLESLNEGEAATEMGFIAQDVYKLVPEVVDITESVVEVEGKEPETVPDYHSMSYARLTALLTEAVKELKNENDALRDREGKLEARLGELESQNKDILKKLEGLLEERSE